MADDWRPQSWREVLAGDALIISMGVFGAGAAGRGGVVLGTGIAIIYTAEFIIRGRR